VVTKALILNDAKPLLSRVREFLLAVDMEFIVDKAFLFGSTAKGGRNAESDVDLIVISKGFRGLQQLERVEKILALWHYVEELEILAYTPEEFAHVKNRFLVKEILSYALDLTPNPHSTGPVKS
jgi:predicted nucleotidyltransferase